MASLASTNSENEWRAEDDMRTLARAEEIKRDPKRFAAAKRMAQKRIQELEAMAGEDKDTKRK